MYVRELDSVVLRSLVNSCVYHLFVLFFPSRYTSAAATADLTYHHYPYVDYNQNTHRLLLIILLFIAFLISE